MKIKIFLMVIFCLLLCGCSPENEPDKQYMVTALGADENKKLYLQVVDFQESTAERPQTFTIVGEGEDLKGALLNAESRVSKKLSVKHCELIIIESDMLGSEIMELLELCDELDVSLQARLATTENLQKLLKNEGVSSGAELISLIKQNAKSSGFGGHTALYEIKTAILTAGGNFALPFLSDENVTAVEGLLIYKGTNPEKRLDFTESIEYSKEKKLYEGEK